MIPRQTSKIVQILSKVTAMSYFPLTIQNSKCDYLNYLKKIIETIYLKHFKDICKNAH